MDNILTKARKFSMTSLSYVDEEEIEQAVVCSNGHDQVFLYNEEEDRVKIHWAAYSKDTFSAGLKEALDCINSRGLSNKNIYIEFIPEELIPMLKKMGFEIASEWVDYWIDNIEGITVENSNTINLRPMEEGEQDITSAITRACKGYSRGFFGETPEFIKEWHESKNSTILVAEEDRVVVGLCFVNLYGFDSKKGTVVWIREVAVDPKHHLKGIGRQLIKYGISWGKANGAVRSFLACDVENPAVKLYEKLGYRRKPCRGQINMEKWHL